MTPQAVSNLIVSLVIGLTGPNAAGKGEVASYLAVRGYASHSLSDIVRESAAKEGLPPTREHLIRIGNELRRAGGAGVLAEHLLERVSAPAVVDSIRNPAEVEALRRHPDFILLGVEASLEARFARTVTRNRAGDPATIEEYRRREAQENDSDPNSQQLANTFSLADTVIANDGSLEALHQAIDEFLEGR